MNEKTKTILKGAATAIGGLGVIYAGGWIYGKGLLKLVIGLSMSKDEET